MSIYSQNHKKWYTYCPKNPELFRVKMDGTDSNRCNKIQQKHKEDPADKPNGKKNIPEVVKQATANGCVGRSEVYLVTSVFSSANNYTVR